MTTFRFLNHMSDNWLAARRLREKGDKESLKKLKKMEDEQLVLVDELKK